MSSLLEKAKKVVMDEEVENEEGYDDFNYEEYSVPEEPSTPQKRRLPILIDNNGIATIENCLFAVIVAVAVPWVFPFILELYFKSHNKARTFTVVINYLMIRVWRNYNKIVFIYRQLIVFADDKINFTFKSILYFVKGVLCILSKQAFVFTADNSRPENSAFHKRI